MLPEFHQLLLHIRRQFLDIFFAGHIEVLKHILAGHDLNFVEEVYELAGRRIGRAIDHLVGSGSGCACIAAGGRNRERELIGVAIVGGETDRSRGSRGSFGSGDGAVNAARWSLDCGRLGSLGKHGYEGECQQAQPK